MSAPFDRWLVSSADVNRIYVDMAMPETLREWLKDGKIPEIDAEMIRIARILYVEDAIREKVEREKP